MLIKMTPIRVWQIINFNGSEKEDIGLEFHGSFMKAISEGISMSSCIFQGFLVLYLLKKRVIMLNTTYLNWKLNVEKKS